MRRNRFQSDSQISLLLGELPDLVLLANEEGLICYANQCSKEQLHRTDLSGISFRSLVDKRDLARFPEQPGDWVNWQGRDDNVWELRLDIEGKSQLVSGKAKRISLPTQSSAAFEGVLIVLRLVGLPNQRISTNLLMKAIASASSAIVVVDVLQEDMPISYVNLEFLNVSGYEPTDVIGKNCRFLRLVEGQVPDGDDETNRNSLSQIKAAIAHEEKTSVTLKNYRKDGTLFYNELHIAPVYENAQLVAYVGVQNDVTEQVRSQQQLLERERTLSSFLAAAAPLMGVIEFPNVVSDAASDAAPDVNSVRHVITNAANKDFTDAKPKLHQPLEITAALALLGLDERAQKQWKAAFEQCLKAQSAVKMEYEITYQQGRRFFQVTINPVATEPGAARRCCYVAEEITDLLKAEAARSLMESAVENIDKSVVITTPDLDGEDSSKIIYVNKAFTRITGYTAAEAIGQTPKMLQGELTNPSVLNRMKEGLVENRRFRGETINYRKSGEQFVMEWVIAPITDDDDQVTYWVAAQQNVTRRRQLEKEVLDSQTHEQERIARDLHDSVQQRLNVIYGLTQILRLKLKDQLMPDVDQLLIKLSNASKQAVTEVRAIAHGLSSISSSRDGLMRALQQLATTTQEVLRTHCEFTYEQPVLIDDAKKASHLYRIAQEAVNNAIRHGRAKQILIGLSHKAPECYTLTISDDGCGISQSDAASQSGIGLNSMRYRAEAIDADLVIASDDRGRGTVVTCTFACKNAISESGATSNSSQQI